MVVPSILGFDASLYPFVLLLSPFFSRRKRFARTPPFPLLSKMTPGFHRGNIRTNPPFSQSAFGFFLTFEFILSFSSSLPFPIGDLDGGRPFTRPPPQQGETEGGKEWVAKCLSLSGRSIIRNFLPLSSLKISPQLRFVALMVVSLHLPVPNTTIKVAG